MGAATVMVRLDTLPQDVVEKILAAAESPNLPTVKNADKGKFVHVNESTGEIEYAEGGSGGGVLVVTDTDGTLDKTWQEIHDAMLVGGVVLSLGDTRAANISGVDYSDRIGSYFVSWCKAGEFLIGTYTASSADGYPAT